MITSVNRSAFTTGRFQIVLREDLPKDFVNHILTQSFKSGAEIWSLILTLQSDQLGTIPKGDESSKGASIAGERSKTPLPMEALLLAFFSATVFEIFEHMDESSWRKGESDGLFENMAAIRRSLSQNPSAVAKSIETVRTAFGLSSSQECLSSLQSRRRFGPADEGAGSKIQLPLTPCF